MSSISPVNGPTVGGTNITITGANYGTSDSSVSATIGGVAASWCIWINDNTIQCETPEGIGANNVVDVMVGGQTSTSDVDFAYDGIAPPQSIFIIVLVTPPRHTHTLTCLW